MTVVQRHPGLAGDGRAAPAGPRHGAVDAAGGVPGARFGADFDFDRDSDPDSRPVSTGD